VSALRVAVVGNGRSVHAVGRAAAVAAAGHQVRLVTLGPVLSAEGLEVRTREIPRQPLLAIQAARSFLRDVREFRPDVLHVHYAGGKLGTMACLAGVRPLVATVMGGDVLPEQHPGGRMHPLERRATARLLQQADAILVKSDALRPAVAAFGDHAARVETVRWGVDPARFRRDPEAAARLRAQLGLQADERVIACPRIVDPLYNQHLLVEALPAVLSRVPRARLLLSAYNAQPGYLDRVQALAAALGVADRLLVSDRIEHAEMPALYSLCEVAVAVPSSDGLPQSLFEAMACGAPMLLGRLPGYAEVVRDGEHVLLADLAAPAIAAALLRLLEDRELARGLAGRALARVGEVALLPREVERVVACYRRAIAAPPRPRLGAPGRLLDVLGLFLR
jgi:glycosyltransferase involved in cell wall biosynthesis